MHAKIKKKKKTLKIQQEVHFHPRNRNSEREERSSEARHATVPQFGDLNMCVTILLCTCVGMYVGAWVGEWVGVGCHVDVTGA